jgi:hypothetical protein
MRKAGLQTADETVHRSKENNARKLRGKRDGTNLFRAIFNWKRWRYPRLDHFYNKRRRGSGCEKVPALNFCDERSRTHTIDCETSLSRGGRGWERRHFKFFSYSEGVRCSRINFTNNFVWRRLVDDKNASNEGFLHPIFKAGWGCFRRWRQLRTGYTPNCVRSTKRFQSGGHEELNHNKALIEWYSKNERSRTITLRVPRKSTIN